MKKILVIIVTYNAMKWVEKSIGSIYSSSLPADTFVVDNGSTDGTQDYIREHFPEVIFKQSSENLGFGKANNIGLQYAVDNNYDYVYLLNQDAWVYPNTFEIMINSQYAHPEYGILSPMQLQANERHLDVNFMKNLCYQGRNVIEDCIVDNKDNVSDIPMIMAAHWLISKECLTIVGGFSPSFPHYGEDNNYAERTIYHGLKLGVVRNAYAIHDREFREKSTNQKIYDLYINYILISSRIYMPHKHPLLSFCYHCFVAIFKYRNFLPLRYLLMAFINIFKVRSNRELSKNKGAFI